MGSNLTGAPLTVTVKSENQGGFESKIFARDHTLTADQPFGFRGTNLGFKPSELLLAALAACQEVTWRLYAESLGIDIKRISIELRGTQDLRGFMGLDETIPPGFMEIEGEVRIDSSASATELEELQKLVDNHHRRRTYRKLPAAVVVLVMQMVLIE